jgi:Glucose / Sorbosone dehydrogenase
VGLRIHLEEVAMLDEPIAMAVRRGDPALYIAQKRGEVMATRPGTRSAPTAVLDLSGSVRDTGEEGLLGIAFSPDGKWLYASYDDRNGDSNLVACRFSGGAAQRPGRRILLVRQPPFTNHNGGDMAAGRRPLSRPR